MNKEFNSLLKRTRQYTDNVSEERLKKAFDFAEKVYDGQERISGDSVFQHTIETAKILTTLKVDEETLIAAILHEVPEYSNKHYKRIESEFGKEVAVLVSAYEKMGTINTSGNAGEMETLRKMALVMAKDLRVVLIKLSDRLNNLQTLEKLDKDFQKEMARETLDIYVPLSSRLGVYSLRSMLEDLCFRYLNEIEYRNIQAQLKVLGKKKKNAIEDIKKAVDDFLKSKKIEASVAGRYKNTYSIYKKLKKKGRSSIDDIHDIFAIRIILPTKYNDNGEEKVGDLYELIGYFHNQWKPLPGRFKDYVGFPKPNGYRSLHTTIIGLAPHSHKEPVEIQIRTEKMHEEAEYGIAAHWLYKESKGSSTKVKNEQDLVSKQRAQLDWIQSLAKLSMHLEGETNEETMKDLKVDLFQDRIFVFTPQGEVKDLPQGSTPIDFAYSVHSDVGNRCTLAKVNGSVVPLNYELQNGEIVEIMTYPNSSPKLEWLSFAKTSGARGKIKTFFRSFDQDRNFKEGKALLNKKLEQIGKPKLDPKLTILKNFNGEVNSFKKREEIVKQVGSGSVLASSIIKKIYTPEEIFGSVRKESVKKTKIRIEKESDLGKYIVVGGEKGLPVRIAKCCKPSFGQPISAFITRGKAISIHKKECPIYKMSDLDRRITAKWVDSANDDTLNVTFIVETDPNMQIMREVTKQVNKKMATIMNFHIAKRNSEAIYWQLQIEITDFTQFSDILNNISSVNGVHSVKKMA
ncbi:bifunctional (p)ppGpp synthetase/guanosine-3',5'-bis(diphosphate) 3'-pyrophosphohydrolase [bacterium]|nr:bifunctional (p)ppGpp synthetase/guanosine-3',5'-bis(diphosphate) 3'-pyrophosphohydrolase [bacterium]